MKEFNWSEFKDTNNIIAVHCKTKEEAEDFCKKMHEQGIKWRNGTTYLGRTKFDSYFDQMCYYGDGGYSRLKYAKEKGYEILEWSDYMRKEFTKADLKDGMVIETREKERYLVLGDRAVRETGFNRLEGYADDLTECRYHIKKYDIDRVFKVKNDCLRNLESLFEDCNLDLIWERKKTKRMTTEETRKKLEELTGEKIEIEPTREEMIGKLELYRAEKSCSKCVLSGMSPGCNYWKCDSEKLKQCYEKVMEMDEKKVREAIERVKNFPEWNRDDLWLGMEDMEELTETILEALEKQLRLKPIRVCDKESVDYQCPICGTVLMSMYPDYKYGGKTDCCKCKQLIDWSE